MLIHIRRGIHQACHLFPHSWHPVHCSCCHKLLWCGCHGNGMLCRHRTKSRLIVILATPRFHPHLLLRYTSFESPHNRCWFHTRDHALPVEGSSMPLIDNTSLTLMHRVIFSTNVCRKSLVKGLTFAGGSGDRTSQSMIMSLNCNGSSR